MADGGDYKFATYANQIAQARNNKVVALVCGKDVSAYVKDCKPAVIFWTNGASAVTILDRLVKVGFPDYFERFF